MVGLWNSFKQRPFQPAVYEKSVACRLCSAPPKYSRTGGIPSMDGGQADLTTGRLPDFRVIEKMRQGFSDAAESLLSLRQE